MLSHDLSIVGDELVGRTFKLNCGFIADVGKLFWQ